MYPVIIYNKLPITLCKPYNQINSIMIAPADIFLSTSIILETFSTVCLKNTLQNKLWYIPSYSGYALSFYIFPKAFSKYSLNKAYTLWCGFGIIFTCIIDKIIYKELLTLRKVIGVLIIISGIAIIK
uniref:EamA domain-containing protein n=1 Tax=viral metagenome TaxID=1070528 RepID=A0A6C0AXK8_9ZZZZ